MINMPLFHAGNAAFREMAANNVLDIEVRRTWRYFLYGPYTY